MREATKTEFDSSSVFDVRRCCNNRWFTLSTSVSLGDKPTDNSPSDTHNCLVVRCEQITRFSRFMFLSYLLDMSTKCD